MVVAMGCRKVNKLIWPAPGGIGMHQLKAMESVQQGALQAGLINRTVSLIPSSLLAPMFRAVVLVVVLIA